MSALHIEIDQVLPKGKDGPAQVKLKVSGAPFPMSTPAAKNWMMGKIRGREGITAAIATMYVGISSQDVEYILLEMTDVVNTAAEAREIAVKFLRTIRPAIRHVKGENLNKLLRGQEVAAANIRDATAWGSNAGSDHRSFQ